MNTLKTILTSVLFILSTQASAAYLDSNADIAEMKAAQRDTEAVARMRLAKNIEQIYRSTKAEMSQDGMVARTAECERFVNETRYKAATIYIRIQNLSKKGIVIDLTKDSSLTTVSANAAQSWVGFALKQSRNLFAGAFSPKSCTGNADSSMTQEGADAAINNLDRALRKLELQ